MASNQSHSQLTVIFELTNTWRKHHDWPGQSQVGEDRLLVAVAFRQGVAEVARPVVEVEHFLEAVRIPKAT
jgi:hypothetical protein